MRGKHQLLLAVLLAGVLGAGTAWAQQWPDHQSVPGSSHKVGDQVSRPGQFPEKSEAAPATSSKKQRQKQTGFKFEGYSSEAVQSNSSFKSKDEAAGYGVTPKPRTGLTVEEASPSTLLGSPAPQATSSPSYFDGLLSRTLKDWNQQKPDRPKRGKKVEEIK